MRKRGSNFIVDKVGRLAAEAAAREAAAAVPPPPEKQRARSLAIAQGGLRTGFDTINMLTATITDVLEESITTSQASVVVNAIGKVLKVVELQFKYGKTRPDGGERDLVLNGRTEAVEH